MSSAPVSIPDMLAKARENLTLCEARVRELKEMTPLRISDDGIKAFINRVQFWYPIYEHYGEQVYKESSVFWRITTYFPWSGFSTYTKIGMDAAKLDQAKFKEFLQTDIAKEIALQDRQIQFLSQIILRNKR